MDRQEILDLICSDSDVEVQCDRVVEFIENRYESPTEIGVTDPIYRNARAYGWEIGRGQPLAERVQATPENPFLKDDWWVAAGLSDPKDRG